MSKSSVLDRTAKNYILDNIDNSSYSDKELDTTEKKIAFLKESFYDEYGWRVAQVGEHKALIDWFQGLPSSCYVDFQNYEILELAKTWDSIPEDATEKQEDKILDNWWNFIAVKTGQLFSGYHIPK